MPSQHLDARYLGQGARILSPKIAGSTRASSHERRPELQRHRRSVLATQPTSSSIARYMLIKFTELHQLWLSWISLQHTLRQSVRFSTSWYQFEGTNKVCPGWMSAIPYLLFDCTEAQPGLLPSRPTLVPITVRTKLVCSAPRLHRLVRRSNFGRALVGKTWVSMTRTAQQVCIFRG